MVFPFTTKSRFRKIFSFVPGPRFGIQRVVEEAYVRATLHDIEVRLRECAMDIRAISVKYSSLEEEFLSGEMTADTARMRILDARRTRLETRQKKAISLAKKCGFAFLEIYDSLPQEQGGGYQPII